MRMPRVRFTARGMMVAVEAGSVLAACYMVNSALVLVAVAAMLFAVLLRRSGLSRRVVAGVAALHVFLLFLVVPLSAPLAGIACFASGTCAYAALVVRRPSDRQAVLVVTHVLFFILCAGASPMVAIVFESGLALLTGLFCAMGRVAIPVKPSILAVRQTPATGRE